MSYMNSDNMNGRMGSMHGMHEDGCGCGQGNGCGCGSGIGMGRGMRAFLTNEEKVELLKEYRESLQGELKAVEERIRALGKED